MKLSIKRLWNWIKKRKYQAILQDREDLSDYEKNFFIPALKSRLENLKKYFQSIVDLCEKHKKDPLFASQLTRIINPTNIKNRGKNENELAEHFFSEIQKQAKEQNIDEIDEILLSYSCIDNLKKLGKFLNQVNFLCSSLVEVNNNLFLFNLLIFPHAIHTTSGNVLPTEPLEYRLTIKPFENTINNIVSVSKATSDTIHIWHKEFMEGKSRFLEYYDHKVSLRNNRIVLFIQVSALILGIALSALFLLANDPFNQFKKNQILQQSNSLLQSEIEICKQDQIKIMKEKNEYQVQLETQNNKK